jgi:hypothetical protein
MVNAMTKRLRNYLLAFGISLMMWLAIVIIIVIIRGW